MAGPAFEVLGLHRLSLYHAVDNQASCGVALRAGFQLEGLLRQGYRYGDGNYHDEHVHGLLAADVRASRPSTDGEIISGEPGQASPGSTGITYPVCRVCLVAKKS